MFFRWMIFCFFISFSSFAGAAPPSIERNILLDDVYRDSLSSLPPKVREAQKAIWSIRKRDGQDIGTAFFISPNLALTAFHVLRALKEDSNHIYLFQEGKPFFEQTPSLNEQGAPMKIDRRIHIKRIQIFSVLNDLALISTPLERPVDNYLKLSVASPDPRENIYSIHRVKDDLRVTEKQGTHLSLHNGELRFFTNRSRMQGMSGSPLLNGNGQVMGLHVEGRGNYAQAASAQTLMRCFRNIDMDSFFAPQFNNQTLNSIPRFVNDSHNDKMSTFNVGGLTVPLREIMQEYIYPDLLQKAEEGMLEAQMSLYMEDRLIKKINQEVPEGQQMMIPYNSDHWLREAAQNAHAPALFQLAENLRSEDPQKSFQLFSQAEELGEIMAGIGMADMLLKGEGVPQDKEKALSIYQRLAEEGSARASFELAKYYLDTAVYPEVQRSTEDLDKAYFHLKKAVETGMPDAIFLLAQLYDEGSMGEKVFGPVEKDRDRAWLLYALSADVGHVSSEVTLIFNFDVTPFQYLPPNPFAKNYKMVRKFITDRNNSLERQKHSKGMKHSKGTRVEEGLCRRVISKISRWFFY